MKSSSIIPSIALGVIALAACNAVRADTPAQIKAQIATLYHKQDVAMAHKDVDGFFEAMDPDVNVITPDGDSSTSISQLRDNMEKTEQLAKSIVANTKIVKFSTGKDDLGPCATVTVKAVSHLVIFAPNGKKLSMQVFDMSRDYWQKHDDGWKIIQSRLLSEVMFINGKKVNPNDMEQSLG